MKSASLRLESFAAARTTPQPTAAELDEAYHDGHERGLAEGRKASLDALTAEMARLRHGLSLLAEQEQAIRRDTLAAVTPALALIIDLLGRAGARERLLDALQAELARLVQTDGQGEVIIRCPIDMRHDIQPCLDRAGLQARLLDAQPGSPGIEITAQGGSIRLDPDRPATELRAIIDELHSED